MVISFSDEQFSRVIPRHRRLRVGLGLGVSAA